MTSELIFDLAVTHRPQRTISSIERRRTGVDQPAPEVCSMSTMSLIPGSTCAGEQVLLRHRGRYHLARDSRAPRAVRGPVRAGELQRAMSGGGAERRGEQTDAESLGHRLGALAHQRAMVPVEGAADERSDRPHPADLWSRASRSEPASHRRYLTGSKGPSPRPGLARGPPRRPTDRPGRTPHRSSSCNADWTPNGAGPTRLW